MKRWLLALVVLLGGSVASAQADYLVIIANLGQQDDPLPIGPMQPGVGGDNGVPMGRGGPAFQQRGGAMMGGGMIGGAGILGNQGVPAQPPAPPPPPPAEGLNPDTVPFWLTAVVEVEPINAELAKNFLVLKRPIGVKGRWGKATVAETLGAHGEIKTMIIKNDTGTLDGQYEQLKLKTYPKGSKDKPDTDAVLNLASWCLQHGSLSLFKEAMDQFVKDDGKHPSAIAYAKVKAELAKPAKNPDLQALRQRLFKDKNYRSSTSDHYIAYHNQRKDDPSAVMSRLKRLEHNYESFFYWFALRGTVIPLPAERLPVIVTYNDQNNPNEFNYFNDILSSSPIIADSFVARREGLAVFSAKRLDTPYEALEKYTSQYWSMGVARDGVLTTPETAFPPQLTRDAFGKATLQSMALLMKTLESDAELQSTTHNGTRQLLYATGMLQRNVVAPEWFQFGVGSFFETPPGSPWRSTGAASYEYLPLIRDLKKAKRLGKTPAETLRMIVTDGYFRQAQMDGEYGSLRRARATSWAFMYYLANGNKLDGQKPNLEGFQRYFKELAKMPRDLELDEETLLLIFCKSFGLADGNDKIDAQKFEKAAERFATVWENDINETRLELQNVVTWLRETASRYAPASPDSDKVKEGSGQHTLATQTGGAYHPKEVADPNQPINPDAPGVPRAPGVRPGGMKPGFRRGDS